MGRGKGKGKGRGGGGKMFVANIEELQMREAQVEEAKMKRYCCIVLCISQSVSQCRHVQHNSN
jgi:hypothetical protein